MFVMIPVELVCGVWYHKVSLLSLSSTPFLSKTFSFLISPWSIYKELTLQIMYQVLEFYQDFDMRNILFIF